MNIMANIFVFVHLHFIGIALRFYLTVACNDIAQKISYFGEYFQLNVVILRKQLLSGSKDAIKFADNVVEIQFIPYMRCAVHSASFGRNGRIFDFNVFLFFAV